MLSPKPLRLRSRPCASSRPPLGARINLPPQLRVCSPAAEAPFCKPALVASYARRVGGSAAGAPAPAKTHLCIGVASAIIRSRARGRFFNLVDLVQQLEQEKAAGRSGSLPRRRCATTSSSSTSSVSSRSAQPGGQLLFHLIPKLYENTSLLRSADLGFADWGQVFGDAKMIRPYVERHVRRRMLCHGSSPCFRLWTANRSNPRPSMTRDEPPRATNMRSHVVGCVAMVR